MVARRAHQGPAQKDEPDGVRELPPYRSRGTRG